MTEEAKNYIIKNYPTGDYDKMIADLQMLGMRISKKSSLQVMANTLGVIRDKKIRFETRRKSVLKAYQNDRERVAAGLPPITKKIKPYKMTWEQYDFRRFLRVLGYVLTRSDIFSIGINHQTTRSETLEQKGISLGFNFYGCTDNPQTSN